MKPAHITFTGLDERTDLKRCAELSERYPIEWGVLFGGKIGKTRYPDLETRMRIEASSLRLSAHLCRDVADRFQHGDHLPLQRYGRIQVNARSYQRQILGGQALRTKQRIILQHRTDRFPDDPCFDYLLDRSGGRGKAETTFPHQHNHMSFVGYAGGIGPENVRNVLAKINAQHFWIDMESGVRTGDWLDLDRCEDVCWKVWSERALPMAAA